MAFVTYPNTFLSDALMPVYWFCKSTEQQNWIVLPELILFSPHHLISLTLPYMKYYKKVLF